MTMPYCVMKRCLLKLANSILKICQPKKFGPNTNGEVENVLQLTLVGYGCRVRHWIANLPRDDPRNNELLVLYSLSWVILIIKENLIYMVLLFNVCVPQLLQ